MTAILVIAARDIVPDNGINDHLKVRKGQPASVQAAGHPIGPQEGLPNWCRINVTDAFRSDLFEYLKAWTVEVDFEVLSHDPSGADTYQVRAYNANTAVNLQNYVGRGQLTRDKVEGFLMGWNATVSSANENNVVFTATIFDALRSRGFWRYPGFILQQMIFTRTNYAQASGIHTFDVDYSAVSVNPNIMEDAVLKAGANLIDHQPGVITFSASRTLVIQRFKEEVRERTRNYLRKRQYYVTDAAVDNIVSNGGTVDADLATLQRYIRNRLTD